MNKNIIWVAVAALVVVIGGIYVISSMNDAAIALPDITQKTASSTASTTSQSPVPAAPAPKPATLSYTKAVTLYADRRIQFNEQCEMIPNPAMFRNGKEVMLDNRASKARSVSISGTSYSLSAYGFKIITLYRSKLPATLTVNCGSGVNTGKITLQ